MRTYDSFLKTIMMYKKISNDIHELHLIGVDLIEGKYKIEESVYELFKISLEDNFTTEGIDWINWFIFENDYGQKDWSKIKSFDDTKMDSYGARDENGNPICHSYESTWEYVKQYLK